MRSCLVTALLVSAFAFGCGGSEPAGSASGGGTSSGGPPPLEGCAPGAYDVDGACRPAGVAPEECAEGFVSDGVMGCTATLPPTACAKGKMAIPGETACRDVAPCGTGPWGEIPVDAATQYVDGTYSGADSDGSAAKPWLTVAPAIAAADPGAVVAIAAGSYVEDVKISSKPVRLWGRCPSMVTLVGTGVASQTVLIKSKGASGTEVHSVALTGTEIGVAMSGVHDVLLEQVWIHDASYTGVEASNVLGAAEVEIRSSLIELSGQIGVHTIGSVVDIESSLVRDAQSVASNPFGAWNVGGEVGSELTLRGSVIESAEGIGVYGIGADIAIDRSVIRDNLPQTADQTLGDGIVILGDGMAAGTLTLTGSVVERNVGGGVSLQGATGTIEASVVRDTTAQKSDLDFGQGVSANAEPTDGTRSSLTIRRSLVRGNHSAGVAVGGSDALLEGVVVGDTLPEEHDQSFGVGVTVQDFPEVGQRSSAELRGCVVERNHYLGILAHGSDSIVERTAVRDTDAQASDMVGGLGIAAQKPLPDGSPASLTLRASSIDGSLCFGIALSSADATIESTTIRGTGAQRSDGLYGDGISIAAWEAPGRLVLNGVTIEASARAAVSNFSAVVEITSSSLGCNPIPLDGEIVDGVPYRFENGGGNLCGCGADASCQAISSQLDPPRPLDPLPQPGTP